MTSTTQKLVAFALFLLFVAAGVGVAVVLVKTKAEPKKSEHGVKAVPVEIHVVTTSTQPVRVIANGTVISAQEIILQPEVTGRIIWKNPQFVPGGRFKKGAPLLRIDPRDYAVAVQQQLAQIENTRLGLDQERGRRVIAEREWALFGDAGSLDADADAPGRSLALREPHLRSAEASLRAAQSGLEKAKIGLSRTQIVAPFNAFVQSEAVDVGQLVSPSMQLGRLVGTDAFWVQVSVPVDRLGWLRVPGLNADEGSSVKIVQQVGEGRVEREGKIIRLYGDVDPVGRMARVLVEVVDPFGLASSDAKKKAGEKPSEPLKDGAGGPSASELPLLLGAYVRVSIDAGTLDGVVEVPRSAVHEGDVVYVIDSESKLRFKRPEIVWRRETTMLVRGELASGDKIVTTHLSAPLEGMLLRVSEEDKAAKAEATEAK